jgi:hypothetical protein
MEILGKTRLVIGKYALRKRMKNLKKPQNKGNLGNAKKIGIVWDTLNSEDFYALSQFHLKMAERKIDVKIIGYYPGKILPDKFTAIRYLLCLKPEDIDLYYKPVSKEAVDFIKTRFDILIDANFKNTFTLEYITTLSQAVLKVGIFDNGYDNQPFDLMIEVDRTTDINLYLSQVVHYLEMINTGTNKSKEKIITT